MGKFPQFLNLMHRLMLDFGNLFHGVLFNYIILTWHKYAIYWSRNVSISTLYFSNFFDIFFLNKMLNSLNNHSRLSMEHSNLFDNLGHQFIVHLNLSWFHNTNDSCINLETTIYSDDASQNFIFSEILI